jgi:hypothetical protein
MHSLALAGLTLRSAGGYLEVHGPTHRLTPEQKTSLAEHKQVLLQMLELAEPEPFPDWVMQGLREAEVYWGPEVTWEEAYEPPPSR